MSTVSGPLLKFIVKQEETDLPSVSPQLPWQRRQGPPARCPFAVSFLGEGSPTAEEKIGYQLILTSLEDLGRVLVLCGLAPPKKKRRTDLCHLPLASLKRIPSRSSAEDLDLRVGDLDMVESDCRPPFFPLDIYIYIYIVMYMYIMSLILVLDNLSTRGP